MAGGRDLEGVPRPLDGDADGLACVDMGAFEFAGACADTDGDGLADSAELRADTDPRNSADCLQIVDVRVTGGTLELEWKGGVRATQCLERAPGPGAAGPDWEVIRTNVPPTLRSSLYTESIATNTTQFYRIRIAP